MSNSTAPLSCLLPDTNEAPVPLTWSEVQFEKQILAVLEAPPLPHERLEFAFRRKESELLALFDRLSLQDSRQLHRRLTLMLTGDPIAAKVTRLVAARRHRLLAFLADAPRRGAIRATRR